MNMQNPPRAGANGTGGRRRPPRTPKGRQVDPQALDEMRALLDRPAAPARSADRASASHPGPIRPSLRRASRRARAEMKLALTEVYEVATFYAHFDVVKEGETPPPPVTVRVCDSLSCAMAGAEKLLRELPGKLGKDVRVVRAPCMGACDRAPVVRGRPCADLQGDAGKIVAAAVKAKRARACLEAGRRFRRLSEGGRLCAAERLPRRQAHARRADQDRRAMPACAASAARDFRPAANGRSCARSRRRACWRSTPTRASPARSRIATISSAIRTASSKAC